MDAERAAPFSVEYAGAGTLRRGDERAKPRARFIDGEQREIGLPTCLTMVAARSSQATTTRGRRPVTDDMRGGDYFALAEIDAVAGELLFQWRSLDDIDGLDPQFVVKWRRLWLRQAGGSDNYIIWIAIRI